MFRQERKSIQLTKRCQSEEFLCNGDGTHLWISLYPAGATTPLRSWGTPVYLCVPLWSVTRYNGEFFKEFFALRISTRLRIRTGTGTGTGTGTRTRRKRLSVGVVGKGKVWVTVSIRTYSSVEWKCYFRIVEKKGLEGQFAGGQYLGGQSARLVPLMRLPHDA
ncbi:hypothetical protein V1477_007569, partial [Vespula maculifrons]